MQHHCHLSLLTDGLQQMERIVKNSEGKSGKRIFTFMRSSNGEGSWETMMKPRISLPKSCVVFVFGLFIFVLLFEGIQFHFFFAKGLVAKEKNVVTLRFVC